MATIICPFSSSQCQFFTSFTTEIVTFLIQLTYSWTCPLFLTLPPTFIQAHPHPLRSYSTLCSPDLTWDFLLLYLFSIHGTVKNVNEGNKIHSLILCLWELLWFHFITAPVPVPELYLDHKKHSFPTYFLENLAFLHIKLFYKERIDKFIKFIVKCEWKNIEWRKSKTQIYTVSMGTFLIPFSYGSGFATAKNYGPTVLVSVSQHCSNIPLLLSKGNDKRLEVWLNENSLQISPLPQYRLSCRGNMKNSTWAWILKKSMGARHRVGIGLSYRPAKLHRLAELMP